MRNKTNRFPFTEAKIRALPTPATGRAWHYDTKARGLCICKTAAGGCSFYFYKWLNGRPARMSLGKWPDLTVDQARTAAESAIGQIAAGRDPEAEHRRRRQEPTIADLWGHWLLYATAHKKPVSVYEDKLKYNKFLGPWASRRLSTISKAHVQELHSRVGRESGIYAANRLLALLRSMFNKSEDIGYRGNNPARGVKLFRERSRDRFLQPGELGAFFAALESEAEMVRDFYVTLLLTGARRTNTQEMRWQDVDLQAGIWRIPETKAGMPVIVPLVPPVVAILTRRLQTVIGPWVFPGRRGKAMANPKEAWKRILTAAGLSDLRPHDLRRSYGSWLAGQNVSLPIIGRLLGHRTPQATMVYSRLALDPLREASALASTAILTAGGQTKLLVAPAEKGGDDGQS
jgi:integrase